MQTESPIWNQILTFRIQVLLWHHAHPLPPAPQTEGGLGVCGGVWMDGRGHEARQEGAGTLPDREREEAQDTLQRTLLEMNGGISWRSSG